MSKMEFKINSSPHLKMCEITKRLFNRNFHADVQFNVEGKIIYAHSLELIKRSVVFEEQLENDMGVTIKVIPVTNCKYESFLEFIRFIYTDECTINLDNFVDILRLATKYKVIRLENQVIRSENGVSRSENGVIRSGIPSTEWFMKCFEFCVLHKYEIAREFLDHASTNRIRDYLDHEYFRSLHADAVYELLKYEHVNNVPSELQIFNALAEWIKLNCETQQITLVDGRKRWDHLIKKIRFPTLSIEELRQCSEKYPGLLSCSDLDSIARQSIFGSSDCSSDLWISKGREKFIYQYEFQPFQHDVAHQTIFSVSKETILYGLLVGVEQQRKPLEFEISETDDKTNVSQKLNFIIGLGSTYYWERVVVSLGDSIRLKANFKYTISVKYLEVTGNVNVAGRNQSLQMVINDPGKTVKIIKANRNMLGMCFKPPTEIY